MQTCVNFSAPIFKYRLIHFKARMHQKAQQYGYVHESNFAS